MAADVVSVPSNNIVRSQDTTANPETLKSIKRSYRMVVVLDKKLPTRLHVDKSLDTRS